MQPLPPVAPPPASEPQAEEPARRRFLVPAIIGGAVAVLLPVLWLTGGLDQTPQQPRRAPEQIVDQGKFTVTVHDARITTDKGVFDTKPQRYVVVRMRVVNNDKETASLSSGGLKDGVAARTKAGTWLKPDDVEGMSAGSPVTSVQPGLPIEATAMWKMGPADSPRQFTVGLLEWEFGTGFTDAEYRWRVVEKAEDRLAALFTLPVAAS
ncbi:hypothetical protein [Spirillospora sp. NPDC047279]|uniref:hypothetical protein n=1 Tax=Spirillospora sp. NPDC047279 TaxID=3155478 RepID=UPI0033D6DA36